MTSVIGHLTGLDFDRQYKGWMSCPPGALFEAPVQEDVDKVWSYFDGCFVDLLTRNRTKNPLRIIFGIRPGTVKHCSSGPIVIEKASISALKFATKQRLATLELRSSEPGSATRKERKSHSRMNGGENH
jgi:hypothetical protein